MAASSTESAASQADLADRRQRGIGSRQSQVGSGRGPSSAPAGAASWSVAANRRASLISVKWNGTVVTLACGGRAPVQCRRCGRGGSCARTPGTSGQEQDAHLGVAVGQFLGHEIDSPSGEPPVRALDEVERHAESPRLRQASASSRARCSSSTKWTARISSGVRMRAYWIARATARSRRSMNTSTTWRRRMWAVVAVGTSAFQRLLPLVLAGQPDEEQHHQGHEHDDQPCPVGELGDYDDHVDYEEERRRSR